MDIIAEPKATKKKKGSVGASPKRTYGKHQLLNKITGALAGAFTKEISFLRPPFIFIDLCAGDGIPSYYSGYSSPEILKKQVDFINNRMGQGSAILILVEKDRATFDQLSRSPHAQGAFLFHGDSTSQENVDKILAIVKAYGRTNSPCFIHSDPNKITDWPISPVLLEQLPHYTTILATMGCNVKGMKRLALAKRMQWFNYIQMLTGHVESIKCHDAMLVSLVKDEDNWSYAVTSPIKWKKKTTESAIAAFKDWEKGLDIAWLSDRERFYELIQQRFLTKAEFEELQNDRP